MPRVTHFEINADQPLRAKKFYENVFDWKIEKWEGPVEYWLISTGKEDAPGIDGGLQKRENPGDEIFNYIDVPSVDEFCEKIVKNDGTITVPKFSVPGVGYFAFFKDTEGNLLGIMEETESEK